MANKKLNRDQITKITVAGVLTAVVVILQLLGSFIKFGPFSISLVLIPIVIGAALGGKWVSTWLGFIFGVVVLASGDAAAFLAINPAGTVITVLLKGALAGLVGGLVFEALKKVNTYLAVIVAAILVPVTNTGIFLIGCKLFFFDAITEMAGGMNVYKFMIVGLVGLNFLFELATNIVLSPTVVGVVKALAKRKN